MHRQYKVRMQRASVAHAAAKLAEHMSSRQLQMAAYMHNACSRPVPCAISLSAAAYILHGKNILDGKKTSCFISVPKF